MNRRAFITGLGAVLAAPLAGEAQSSAVRIGYLGQNSPSAPSMPVLLRSFREGLRALGYLEGQNLTIEYRWAESLPERLPKLAAELASMPLDVIVCTGPAGVKATKAATTAISIVAIDFETDPVKSGAIASLSRPGGNLTGIFLDQADLGAKWLQLLREALPKLSRAAVLWDVANPSPQLEAVELGARTLGIDVQGLAVKSLDSLDTIFATAKKAGVQGLVILSSPLFGSSGLRIGDVARKMKIPTISAFIVLATQGLLMAYGPNQEDSFRRLGALVGKVLRGEKTRDIPVERPSRFDLVINLTTAKALGLTIPQSLLLRADQLLDQ